jgi:hypothetical protein
MEEFLKIRRYAVIDASHPMTLSTSTLPVVVLIPGEGNYKAGGI